MAEIREEPVPVAAWDIHSTGYEVKLDIGLGLFERFLFVSGRPLRVLLSNGQTIIVRIKK